MKENVLTMYDKSLYDYYIYNNLIQSIYLRKQGKIIYLVDNNSTILFWGLSIFIGGKFSKANGEQLLSVLKNFNSPRYIYVPDNNWRSFIKTTLLDKVKDKYINLYEFDNTQNIYFIEDEHIVEITQDFIKKNLPNMECLVNELYSYTNMEDFFQNGFGFALVIDSKVVGYCLSEYTINNSHGINIWIDEQYRGLGYAKKMVNNFLLHCKENKQDVYWVCNSDNLKSNKLAISSGFTFKSTRHYFEYE